MDLHAGLSVALIASLVLIHGACGINIGGGGWAQVGSESLARGTFVADSRGAATTMTSTGTALGLGDLRYVQDSTGKRAEISFCVTGAVGSVGYSATFSPKEGMLRTAASSVSASQTVSVARADSIMLHSAAQSGPGTNVAAVDMTASIAGSSPASFTGTTISQATAATGLARIQGRVVGSIDGSASFGGSIAGPYTESKSRSSLGEKVDCSLLMQASSSRGAGALTGTSTFAVGPAEKIQAAINAAWDGDKINIASGTYRENLILDKTLALNGAGADKTVIDGQKMGSVVIIRDGATASLSGMTIQNGNAIQGGGIDNSGAVILTGCKIYNNHAQYGGGICGDEGSTTTVTGSTISDCSAEYGGGIINFGSATITGSTISSNSAGCGGGIYNEGRLYLGGTSLVSDNTATNGYGGGIYSTSPGALMTFDGKNVLIKNNRASELSSLSSWCHGYGVFIGGGCVSLKNGFNATRQITGNTMIQS